MGGVTADAHENGLPGLPPCRPLPPIASISSSSRAVRLPVVPSGTKPETPAVEMVDQAAIARKIDPAIPNGVTSGAKTPVSAVMV